MSIRKEIDQQLHQLEVRGRQPVSILIGVYQLKQLRDEASVGGRFDIEKIDINGILLNSYRGVPIIVSIGCEKPIVLPIEDVDMICTIYANKKSDYSIWRGE